MKKSWVSNDATIEKDSHIYFSDFDRDMKITGKDIKKFNKIDWRKVESLGLSNYFVTSGHH